MRGRWKRTEYLIRWIEPRGVTDNQWYYRGMSHEKDALWQCKAVHTTTLFHNKLKIVSENTSRKKNQKHYTKVKSGAKGFSWKD